jgi:hypothetical protein
VKPVSVHVAVHASCAGVVPTHSQVPVLGRSDPDCWSGCRCLHGCCCHSQKWHMCWARCCAPCGFVAQCVLLSAVPSATAAGQLPWQAATECSRWCLVVLAHRCAGTGCCTGSGVHVSMCSPCHMGHMVRVAHMTHGGGGGGLHVMASHMCASHVVLMSCEPCQSACVLVSRQSWKRRSSHVCACMCCRRHAWGIPCRLW